MTLEQLMLSKGYTQQEINDLSPLLSNAKFRADMESELNDGLKAKKDLDEYDKWFTNEITPEHQNLMKRVADAEADAAAAKARFEAYQKSGMRRQAADQNPNAAAEAAEAERVAQAARDAARNGGVDMSQFVKADTFQNAYEKTGEAIATAINITTQHMQLFPGQYIDMEQLRQEARTAKKPIKDYWENKYGVAAKRAELASKAEAEKVAQIRKEEREKLMVEFGGGSNPNLAIGTASTNPFVIRKAKTDTKQPWEQNPNELNRARVQKAIEKAAARGELATA